MAFLSNTVISAHWPEETSVFQIIGIFIVRLLRTNPHPEEVLWLLPFINYLRDKWFISWQKYTLKYTCRKNLCTCYLQFMLYKEGSGQSCGCTMLNIVRWLKGVQVQSSAIILPCYCFLCLQNSGLLVLLLLQEHPWTVHNPDLSPRAYGKRSPIDVCMK